MNLQGSPKRWEFFHKVLENLGTEWYGWDVSVVLQNSGEYRALLVETRRYAAIILARQSSGRSEVRCAQGDSASESTLHGKSVWTL
jgi:hypothetical protein